MSLAHRKMERKKFQKQPNKLELMKLAFQNRRENGAGTAREFRRR